ncbi:hypothetical protein [Rugamonas sp.]|uniref:hypothetical protein n=1 Tax=Rugamonas sp. TaxID=1926287 RepID=UPI0025DB61B5|nr:hypothetical protein [Rugamonas sp.]
MKISRIRASFALIGATTALLAGCATTPDAAQTADGAAVAETSCDHSDERPLTGTSISHHDCRQHGNVTTLDPVNLLGAARNAGGSVAAGHN